MTPLCQATREGRHCDLAYWHYGPHMWLNALTPGKRPLVVAWGYVNSNDTNPKGCKP